jgi:hypothetical protein
VYRDGSTVTNKDNIAFQELRQITVFFHQDQNILLDITDPKNMGKIGCEHVPCYIKLGWFKAK